MNKLLVELSSRNLLASTSGNLDSLLKTPTTFYVGTDPTADSLHLGHLLAFTTSRLLQKYGHKPIVLIGGATAFIGDPSFKATERKLLDADVVEHNIIKIKAQIEKLLSFDGDNGAIIVNNYDWMKNFSFIDFAREVGKLITVNYMMAKDSVKKRLEREGSGMSFTEFTYQLLQGYDFVHLYKEFGCRLQIGGSDQFGNGTTGIELIRKMTNNTDACMLTWPLVTKADGTKFGKSEKGNIWLDADKTSPYEFYQYFLNTSDEDAERFIKMFTTISLDDINETIEKHRECPSKRLLQRYLAYFMTELVHSKEDADEAVETSEILFGDASSDALYSISENNLLSAFKGVPQVHINKSDIAKGISIVDAALLHENVKSKGEARKLIKANGFSLNKRKVDMSVVISSDSLIKERYILLQKGKKDYTLVIAD